jgi:hypothetical protein
MADGAMVLSRGYLRREWLRRPEMKNNIAAQFETGKKLMRTEVDLFEPYQQRYPVLYPFPNRYAALSAHGDTTSTVDMR